MNNNRQPASPKPKAKATSPKGQTLDWRRRKRHAGHYYTRREKAFISRHYPAHGPTWIARELGLTTSQIAAYVKNHRLLDRPGARELSRELRRRRGAEAMRKLPRESRERAIAARNRVFRMERLRLMMGEPLKTRRRLTLVPSRLYRYRYLLIHRRGYLPSDDPDDLTTYYYTPATRRRGPRSDYEAFARERYGFHFHPADEAARDESDRP